MRRESFELAAGSVDVVELLPGGELLGEVHVVGVVEWLAKSSLSVGAPKLVVLALKLPCALALARGQVRPQTLIGLGAAHPVDYLSAPRHVCSEKAGRTGLAPMRGFRTTRTDPNRRGGHPRWAARRPRAPDLRRWFRFHLPGAVMDSVSAVSLVRFPLPTRSPRPSWAEMQRRRHSMKRLIPLLAVVVACLLLAPVALAQSRVR